MPIDPAVQETVLKPFYPTPGKDIRYYQHIAINAAVKAILEGAKKGLLTLATGTGKTTIAFQIIYKLSSHAGIPKASIASPKYYSSQTGRFLLPTHIQKTLPFFADARCLVPDEGLPNSREIYFSTYHSLAEDERRPGAFRQLPRDFFDLIVIDEAIAEAHRKTAAGGLSLILCTGSKTWANCYA